MCHKIALCVAIGALALLAPLAASGGAPERLPAFEALDREGNAVLGSSLAREGAWILLWVEPRPEELEGLLAILAREVPPERLAVVVGGAPEDAAALAERLPELSPASWLADPERNAFRALALGATPALHGLRGDAIEWRLPGAPAPGDGAAEERLVSTVRSWLAR